MVLINKRFAAATRYQNMNNKKMWLGAEFSEVNGWNWENHYQPFEGRNMIQHTIYRNI